MPSLTSFINWPSAGRYLLAVSGGADSMVLLDLFADAASDRGYELVVAHFDHGLRADSALDRQLVEAAAGRYGLAFVAHQARLGSASEAAARAARHAWLEHARVSHRAVAVVTAHHQDDLLETSLLNLTRGTGRRGLAPMQTGPILRPLLAASRAQLRDYATERRLSWHDDPTNAETSNPRNFLRHRLLPSADSQWRSRYIELVGRLATLNTKVDQKLQLLLDSARLDDQRYSFPRQLVHDLSLSELEELLLAAVYGFAPDSQPSSRTIRELALFAKTARPGRQRPLSQTLMVIATNDAIIVYCMSISKVGKI